MAITALNAQTLPRTLYDKLWTRHLVHMNQAGEGLLFVDRHLLNEVTSPQAFEALRDAGRDLWRPASMIACADHATPTAPEPGGIADPMARAQVEALDQNLRSASPGLYLPFGSPLRGILHVVAPESGATLPGMTIVCGDSHTSTHGAFAALAFGIGTSDVAHVLATQCIWMRRARTLRVLLEGKPANGVTSKDVALAVIGRLGTAGATGFVVEYSGAAVRDMSMEARMTLCNMTIEAGARTGLIGVDQRTIDYLYGRPLAPTGELWTQAVYDWRTLNSDDGAVFDQEIHMDISEVAPMVTWGTSPDMVMPVSDVVPDPATIEDPGRRRAATDALRYMALSPGTPMTKILFDRIFIGSCTNARIEDLRSAAAVVRGQRVHDRIRSALVVPGSGAVKRLAEEEGLHKVFIDAGFQWREPGCSMCLGMNADRLMPGERCASTSNRNFEGRQGAGGRSHLASPAMVAAAALAGHFVDVREVSL